MNEVAQIKARLNRPHTGQDGPQIGAYVLQYHNRGPLNPKLDKIIFNNSVRTSENTTLYQHKDKMVVIILY
jgi:hypothetical protein